MDDDEPGSPTNFSLSTLTTMAANRGTQRRMETVHRKRPLKTNSMDVVNTTNPNNSLWKSADGVTTDSGVSTDSQLNSIVEETGQMDMDFDEEEKDDGSTEIGLPCDYNENMAPDNESIPAMLKINGAHQEGGFRIVPADNQENREAEMLCVLWKDSGEVECTVSNKVWLGGSCH